jgi:c(7)-type cytochrome triheme protein
MRRVAAALAILALSAGLAGRATAVPPGFTIEFDGNGEGKVVFTGAKHTGPDMHCSKCHMEIFYVSRSAPITRPDHKRGNFCFACHDGKQAFAARSNCDRCHEEPEVLPEEQAAAAAPAAAATQ